MKRTRDKDKENHFVWFTGGYELKGIPKDKPPIKKGKRRFTPGKLWSEKI